jgi:epoxyqueuosine reductase
MQSSASARALTDDLKRHASSMGIDLVGCTSASPFLLGEERRQIDPRDTMPEARSIVVAACYVYGFEVHEPSEPGRPRGKFGPWTRASVAAAGYGERTIAEFLEARGYRVASPGNLPRKAAAVRAGIACYGKNSIVHADGFGSYLKLSAVLTDAELACVDGPIEVSDCGDCDACVRACPTGALAQPYRLAREKCICTWMWGDPIAADARAAVGAYIFRCGYCQDACPKASPSSLRRSPTVRSSSRSSSATSAATAARSPSSSSRPAWIPSAATSSSPPGTAAIPPPCRF